MREFRIPQVREDLKYRSIGGEINKEIARRSAKITNR